MRKCLSDSHQCYHFIYLGKSFPFKYLKMQTMDYTILPWYFSILQSSENMPHWNIQLPEQGAPYSIAMNKDVIMHRLRMSAFLVEKK